MSDRFMSMEHELHSMQHEAVRVVHRYDGIARGSGFFVIDLMVLHTCISAVDHLRPC